MIKALPPLLVSAFGAFVAFLFYAVHPATALLLLLPLGIGAWSIVTAKRLTPTDPVGSLRWFDRAQLVPYTIAAATSALLIGVAVWFAGPEKPTPAPGTSPTPPPTFDKYFPDTVKALSGAMSAFLTAAFVKSSEDQDSWVAGQVKTEFEKAFQEKLKGKSAAEALRSPSFGGLGWEEKGRQKRAEAIAAALNLGPKS